MKTLSKYSDLRGGYDKYPNAKSLYFNMRGVVAVRPAKNKDLFIIDKYNNVISLPKTSGVKMINAPFKEVPMKKKMYRSGGKKKKLKYQTGSSVFKYIPDDATDIKLQNELESSVYNDFYRSDNIPDTSQNSGISPIAEKFARTAVYTSPNNPLPYLDVLHDDYNSVKPTGIKKWLNPITGTAAFNTLGNLANIAYSAKRKNPYNRQLNLTNNPYNQRILNVVSPERYLNYIKANTSLSPVMRGLQQRGLPTSQYIAALNRANVDRLNSVTTGYLDASGKHAAAMQQVGAEQAGNKNQQATFNAQERVNRSNYNVQKAVDVFKGINQIGQGASDAITSKYALDQQALAMNHIASAFPQASKLYQHNYTPEMYQSYWGNNPSRVKYYRQ